MTLPPLTRVKTGLVLTWQGWLLALALVGVALWGLGTHLYGYLAHTEPVGGGVLVVEGWLPDEGLRQAKARFEAGGYWRMLVTGGPLQKGYHLARYKTHAALPVATLTELGLEPALVTEIPGPPVLRDRTYASAGAVRDWLKANGQGGVPFDILTLGPHARRTFDLYRLALGPGWVFGVIALSPPDYDPERWWTSSAGADAVIGEAIGWVYVRLWFRPWA